MVMSDSDQSDDESLAVERQIKTVVLGDSCVGKSCLVARYCKNTFSKAYVPTPGVEFHLKREVLQKSKNATVQLWDVGGNSRKLLDKYIFNANIILVVYDVTNEVTFLSVITWVNMIREMCTSNINPPLLALIGNKTDMEHQRIVKQDRQTKLANELHISSHFCSARTGESVNLTFQRVLAEFMGFKLTRSQAEAFQRVVRAEISTHSELIPSVSSKVVQPSSSSVCTIQ